MPDAKIEIKESPIHGNGLYAVKRIVKGTFIGTYEGPQTMEDSSYVLWVGESGEEVGILGQNDLKFLNHHAKPNAEFDGDALYAIKSIPKGREITIHYGEEWEGL